MNKTTLESRIPEVMALLPKRLEGAALTIAEEIASSAQENASGLYEGEQPFDISAEATETGAGVFAHWWWLFGEFGTVNQPPRPFMTPAYEEKRALVTPIVAEWLRDL